MDEVIINVEDNSVEATIVPSDITYEITIEQGSSSTGSGVSNFVDLLDTFNTFSGRADRLLIVNSNETLVDSIDIGSLTIDWAQLQNKPNSTVSAIDDTVTKVTTIETGAEVNNISDTDATDLTDGGDSTLHYHPSDRDRTNHTGVQPASTISDFDTEVSNNTDVSSNTTHRTSDGTDHGYIDQNVTTSASPTFSALSLSNGNVIPTGTQHTQSLGALSNYFNTLYITDIRLRDAIGNNIATLQTDSSGNLSLGSGGNLVRIGSALTVQDLSNTTIVTSSTTGYSMSLQASTGGSSTDNGGDIDLIPGSGGSGGDTDGGNVYIRTGSGNGAGTKGKIYLSNGSSDISVTNNETSANVVTINTSTGELEYRSSSSLAGASINPVAAALIFG